MSSTDESEHDEAANLNKVTAISNNNITVSPRQKAEVGFGIFIGPKLQDELKARDGLEVSVIMEDYLFLPSRCFGRSTKATHFGKLGLAIIFVTL